MPTDLTRDALRQLLEERSDTQLVEVLPAADYGEEHLPGAVNVPLREIGKRARAVIDPKRPVVVYCYDSL